MRALLLLPVLSTASASWMQTLGLLGSEEDGSPRACLALPGLTEQQANVCEKLPETVESVPFGTKQGLVECEYQFRNDRWNCTDNRDTARIQTTLERGSKETAFLYAITT